MQATETEIWKPSEFVGAGKRVAMQICAEHGFSFQQILARNSGYSVKRHGCRAAVAHRLRALGWSFNRIAILLRRDHTTIMHLMRNYDETGNRIAPRQPSSQVDRGIVFGCEVPGCDRDVYLSDPESTGICRVHFMQLPPHTRRGFTDNRATICKHAQDLHRAQQLERDIMKRMIAMIEGARSDG